MQLDFAITRDPASKAATLTVAATGQWEAYAGKDAESMNFASPVASGEGPGEFPLPGDRWTVFSIRQNGESRSLAERRLPMQGGYNFRDPAIAGTYRAFFAHVQESAALPLLFHCAAGKDRTGFAAAMILFALGVDEETIFADYEASNAYLGDKYAPAIAANPEHGGLFTVKRAYLEESLRAIEQEYGHVETYLESALAVDIQLMRERFLV